MEQGLNAFSMDLETTGSDQEGVVKTAPAPQQEFKPMGSQPVYSAYSPDSSTTDEEQPFRPIAQHQSDPEPQPVRQESGGALPFRAMGMHNGFSQPASRGQPVSAPNEPVRRTVRRSEPESVREVPKEYIPPVPDENSSRDAMKKDHRSLTLKELQSAEKSRYENESRAYDQAMKQWKSRVWIPVALLVALLVLILLAGAFAGAVGIVFVILVAGGAMAILAATGKLSWMMKPRKPKQHTPEMGTPEISNVYSVRLRLRSVNLAKPVEITIRKQEQLLGCDAMLCPQPLDFKGISHQHCSIISKQQHGHTEYFIRDEGSKNGTKLNDKRLDPGTIYPLKIGDTVTMAGRYQFRVMSDAF